MLFKDLAAAVLRWHLRLQYPPSFVFTMGFRQEGHMDKMLGSISIQAPSRRGLETGDEITSVDVAALSRNAELMESRLGNGIVSAVDI